MNDETDEALIVAQQQWEAEQDAREDAEDEIGYFTFGGLTFSLANLRLESEVREIARE